MKIIILLFFTSVNLYSQQGWYLLNSGTTQNIGCIYFLDSNNGIAGCDSGIILHTTNGGTTWQSINLNYNNPVFSVTMPSPSIMFTGFQYKIFRSTNAGLTWDTAFGIGAWDFSFVSPSIGYLIFPYTSNYVYKTVNAGQNWNPSGIVFSTNVIRCLEFLNETTGFAGGTWWTLSFNVYSSIVCKSTSSGSNWDIQYSGTNNIYYKAIYSLNFGNSLSGMAVENTNLADSSIIVKTTNGGENWTSSYMSPVMYAIECIGSDFAWLCGNNGVIRYTSNGGASWTSQNSGTIVQLRDIIFINQNTGWAAGNNGIILKTTNGGATGLKSISGKFPQTYSLSQNYPNPFNPVTSIKFSIPPSKGARGMIRLIVYDILGREVTTLVNEQLSPGTYEVKWNASNYPSGVYFYKLTTSDYTETKKMVLIK